MEGNISKESTLGIPPGGMSSPIIFNIYMHKFDSFMTEKLSKLTLPPEGGSVNLREFSI